MLITLQWHFSIYHSFFIYTSYKSSNPSSISSQSKCDIQSLPLQNPSCSSLMFRLFSVLLLFCPHTVCFCFHSTQCSHCYTKGQSHLPATWHSIIFSCFLKTLHTCSHFSAAFLYFGTCFMHIFVKGYSTCSNILAYTSHSSLPCFASSWSREKPLEKTGD